MPFDQSLDQTSFSKTWESDAQRITVSVHSYNQGAKKLQITRENKGPQGDFRFARLGRLSKEEIGAILPFIQEAINSM